MRSSRIAKVFVTFLASMIGVMAGALIYSRVREPRHPIQVVQTAPILQRPPAQAAQTPARKQEALPPVRQAPASAAGYRAPVQNTDENAPESSSRRARTPEAAPSLPFSDGQIAENSTVANRAAERGELTGAPPLKVPSAPPGSTKTAPPEPPPAVPEGAESAPRPLPPETATANPVAAPIPFIATLQPGTAVTIELREKLSSDHNRSGDVFRGSLNSPLVVNGFTVAGQGATVLGKVVNAQKARLLGSASDLTLVLTDITTADGQLIRIETSPWNDEGSKIRLLDAPKVAVGAAYGAAVGAISGAAKGAGVGEDPDAKNESGGMNQKHVVVPIGAHLTFQLIKPVKITAKR